MCIIACVYGMPCGVYFLCVMCMMGVLLPLSLSHFFFYFFVFLQPLRMGGKGFPHILLSIVFPAAVIKYSEKGLLIPVSRSW